MNNYVTRDELNAVLAMLKENNSRFAALEAGHAELLAFKETASKRLDRLESIYLGVNQYCQFFIHPEGFEVSLGDKIAAGKALTAVCERHNLCTRSRSKGWFGSWHVYPIALLERFFDCIYYAGMDMSQAANLIDEELKTLGLKGIQAKLIEEGGICSRLS